MHYYPFNIKSYTAATAHLSNDEDLAYRRLIDLYYDREQALPNDPAYLAERIRMPRKEVMVQRILKNPDFFYLHEDGRFHSARCDREINKYQSMKDGGRKGAKVRWSLRTSSMPPLSPPYTPPIDPLMPTKNQEPRTKNNIDSPLPPEPQNGLLFEKPVKEKKNVRRRAPTSFVPETFKPDIASLKLADELSIPDVDRHADEFVDYWKGCGEQKSDWQATFRTRLRNIAKYRGEREERASGGRPGVRDVSGAALRAAETLRQKGY